MDYELRRNGVASKFSSGRQGGPERRPKILDHDTSVEELLKRYPNGFSVAANGSISKIIMATPHIQAVALNFPAAPCKGGYLVVEMIDDR